MEKYPVLNDDSSLDSVSTRRAEAEIEKRSTSIKKSKVTDEGMGFPLLKEILGESQDLDNIKAGTSGKVTPQTKEGIPVRDEPYSPTRPSIIQRMEGGEEKAPPSKPEKRTQENPSKSQL